MCTLWTGFRPEADSLTLHSGWSVFEAIVTGESRKQNWSIGPNNRGAARSPFQQPAQRDQSAPVILESASTVARVHLTNVEEAPCERAAAACSCGYRLDGIGLRSWQSHHSDRTVWRRLNQVLFRKPPKHSARRKIH